MVESGISFRRQETVLAVPHQTLHARYGGKPHGSGERQKKVDDPVLIDWIAELKTIHPSWGIRRVRAFVRKHTGQKLGRKRTGRIMRELGLLCSRLPKRVHRTTKRRLTATRMNQLWATDMTSFMLTSGVKLFLVVVLDIFTRRIVGWRLSRRCRAREWLDALEQAVQTEFPDGVRDAGLTIRMDNGCQPTSRAYIETLDTLAITGEWVGFNCPEQNAHVESVIGTLKQDWLWLEECDTDDEAAALCQRAVSEYNHDHPHSGLCMLSPLEFTRLVLQGRIHVTEQNTIEILTHAA
jgi:transposase InsO family protein